MFKYNDEIVKTSNIEINPKNTKNYRYSLIIPLKNNKKKTLLIIMMNPSKANKEKSDSTINRIINYIDQNGLDYNKIIITNLYPIYETDSSKLKNPSDKRSNENIEEIENRLENDSNDVLIAWGKPAKKSKHHLKDIEYHKKILNVLKILKKSKKNVYQLGELRELIYPKHAGYIPYNEPYKKVNLECLICKIKEILYDENIIQNEKAKP